MGALHKPTVKQKLWGFENVFTLLGMYWGFENVFTLSGNSGEGGGGMVERWCLRAVGW